MTPRLKTNKTGGFDVLSAPFLYLLRKYRERKYNIIIRIGTALLSVLFFFNRGKVAKSSVWERPDSLEGY